MSRYQARHAMAQPARPGVRKLVAVAGLTTALGVPIAAAAPASASSLSTMVTAKTVSTSTASPTLRQGSHGSAVVTLQRMLRVTADGAFGPKTGHAVLVFQRSRGLAVDGVVGPKTWRALKSTAAKVSTSRTARVSRTTTRSSLGARVVAEAARQKGKPYVYGANGPSSFDCSGFVQYVHSRVGVKVPRTSSGQAAASRPVAKSAKRPGDLIIMRTGGRVSHVGIYAGSNTMWVARHTGTTITRQTLWTSDYSVGRLV